MDNADTFGVSTEDYALLGYSSGGQLAGVFGNEGKGLGPLRCAEARRIAAGLPHQQLLWGKSLPTISWMDTDRLERRYYSYTVSKLVTPDYPPTFLWYGRNDAMLKSLRLPPAGADPCKGTGSQRRPQPVGSLRQRQTWHRHRRGDGRRGLGGTCCRVLAERFGITRRKRIWYDWNGSIRDLNVGLPDDIARLKAAGYYQEAIARIDRLLAEDWTKTQNGPASNGIAPPEGYVPPENPTPHGVDALREALTVQKEIMRRLPGEYCWTEAETIARMQERVRDFTAEEFKKLDWEGRMDWRFVEGEKRYQARFAETLLATHADLAARKLTPDAPQQQERRAPPPPREDGAGGRQRRHHPRTSIRMSDEAFAAALEKAKAEGRDAVHVRAWLALPAACPSQSHITLDRFTETPGHIAAEDAPQRTVCWGGRLDREPHLRGRVQLPGDGGLCRPAFLHARRGAARSLHRRGSAHIVFTPYLRALAAQLTEGITSPAEKAKRIYDYVTLNVRYHFQPSYFVHESIAENCARMPGETAASWR